MPTQERKHNQLQANLSPLKSNIPTTSDLEKCNIAKAQDKYFKIEFIHMLEVLKEDLNKFI